MPTFNFTIKTIKDPKRKASKDNNGNKNKIKNITGVVFIDLKANYYIVSNNNTYNIHNKSYSCKDIRNVYRQGEYDVKRFMWSRNNNELWELNNNFWLPFSVGCIVEGDLIYNIIDNKYYFMINKCYIDGNNNIAKEAFNFYKDNIKQINDEIRKKRLI